MEQQRHKLGIKGMLSELRLYLCNEWIAVIPSQTLRNFYYRNMMKFKIEKSCSVFMHCRFDDADNLSIGSHSVINQRCRIDSRGSVTIGKNVSVSQEVIILTADHDPDANDFGSRLKPVRIDDYVWIGTRATILPGVRIGEGAIVASGAVVTKDVEPFTVVGGVPARYLKTRKKDLNYTVDYRRLFQ